MEFELDIGQEKTNVAPRNKRKTKALSGVPWYYLGLIGDIGFAIAIPIAGGTLLGVFIDRTWGTSPKATLSLLFLGIMVSFINLFTTVEGIIKEKKE